MTKEEAIKKLSYIADEMPSMECADWKEAISMAINVLKQEPKWVPVNERLPEECTAVLVWCPERKNIYCAYYEEKRWWIFGAYWEQVNLEIIAWMPLPEAYKGGQEDGKA